METICGSVSFVLACILEGSFGRVRKLNLYLRAKVVERMLSAQRFSKGEAEAFVGNSAFYNFHFCVLLEGQCSRGPVRGHACTF